MYNPYQAQGNALAQQPTGYYSQQPPPLAQRPTTEFGNYQQNAPNSFNAPQVQQQQHQNPLSSQAFGSPYGTSGQNVQTGQPNLGSNGFSSQQQQHQAGQYSNQPVNSLQAQQTGFYSQQQGNLPTQQQQQQPLTSFFQQGQPHSTLPQQTGVFSDKFSAPPTATQQYQQSSYSSPTPQQTSFSQQAMQPQQTGRYNQQLQQQSAPSAPQPFDQQQTGYYLQAPSQPVQQAPLAYSQQGPQISQQQTGGYTQQVSQPLQSQQTGSFAQAAPQALQPQQTGFYSQTTSQPLQPQQTGFYSQQPHEPIQPLKPTATGFVNSFASGGINNDIKIPNMRLSFITANDQAKFETLFRSTVPRGSNTISGKECRAILMRSGVAPSHLARIWTLCDTSKAGELLFPEFALAMHLVNAVMQGDSVPFELDTKTKNEVSSFVDAINSCIANGDLSGPSQPKTPFDDLTSTSYGLQPQSTGFVPQTSFGMPLKPQNTQGFLNPQTTGFMPQTSFGQPLTSQATGGLVQNQPTGGFVQSQSTGGYLQPQTTGFMPSTSFNQSFQNQVPLSSGALQSQSTGVNTSVAPLNMQQTGGFSNAPLMNPPFLQTQPTGSLPFSNFTSTAPLSAQKTGFGNNEIYKQNSFANRLMEESSDVITSEEKSLFYKIFETYDTRKKGLMDSDTAVEVFRKSGLNRSDLEHIWNLCDTNNSGQLNKQEFALGMHLVYRRLSGKNLPNRLPPSLIPSSTQILNSVKDQLKSTADFSRKAPTKVDGFSFKNNDDEILPSSRNRRKTFVDAKEVEANRDTIASLKDSINKKQSQLVSKAGVTDASSQNSLFPHLNDEQAIEELKRKIRALPQPSLAPISGASDEVTAELRKQFESLTNRVPELLAEISSVNNQIAAAKIELYRQRNPSSLVGTGPNGEVTEADRKKAKSKALLASRMAALTGKPETSANIEQQEQNFNREFSAIRSENKANQEIIEDIQSSIFEIAASVNSAFGRNAGSNSGQYEKWELGIGLDPIVRSFIEDSKPRSTSQSTNRSLPSERSGSQNSAHINSSNPKPQSASVSTGDRSAYLKEQAQRKMKERLAKLGLGKEQLSSPTPPISPPETPKVDQNDKPGNEDYDDEEGRLLQQLEALKAKKRAAKGGFSKAENSEYHAVKEQEVSQANRLNETPAQPPVAIAPSPVSRPQNAPVENSGNDTTPPSNCVQAAETSLQQKYNPFSQSQPTSNVNSKRSGQSSAEGRNPFFKPAASSTSSFDKKAAEAQRRLQRGLDDNDDDWSDEENVSSQVAPQAPVSQAPAPQAPVPQAPVPQAPVPQAPVPQAPIPQAPVPQAPVPQAPIPQAPVPQAPVPQAPVPQAPIPQAPIPQAPVPETPVPETPAAPQAPAAPQMLSSQPPVPIAPPLPQIGQPDSAVKFADSTPATQHPTAPENDENDGNNSDDNFSDDLSIPESVESADEHPSQAGLYAPSGIPPPPPLP